MLNRKIRAFLKLPRYDVIYVQRICGKVHNHTYLSLWIIISHGHHNGHPSVDATQ
jgi:hypothetical protein